VEGLTVSTINRKRKKKEKSSEAVVRLLVTEMKKKRREYSIPPYSFDGKVEIKKKEKAFFQRLWKRKKIQGPGELSIRHGREKGNGREEARSAFPIRIKKGEGGERGGKCDDRLHAARRKKERSGEQRKGDLSE